jgi:hypothetical protein
MLVQGAPKSKLPGAREDPNPALHKTKYLFVIFVKNGLNLDFSRSGLLDQRFSFVKKVKKLFF